MPPTTNEMDVPPLQVSPLYDWHSADNTVRRRGSSEVRLASDPAAMIDVFEDRVRGWFLDVADRLLGEAYSPGEYVAVSILLTYIEGIQQFREGADTPRNKSKEWFIKGLRRILPNLDDSVAEHLWRRVRNGLAHDLFTKERTTMARGAQPVASVAVDVLTVNADELARCVRADFDRYVWELRQNGPVFIAFGKLWTKRWEES